MAEEGLQQYPPLSVLRLEKVIPEFDENGNLPPGVHFCEWEEFVERFGTNELRLRLMRGLRMAMEQLKAVAAQFTSTVALLPLNQTQEILTPVGIGKMWI